MSLQKKTRFSLLVFLKNFFVQAKKASMSDEFENDNDDKGNGGGAAVKERPKLHELLEEAELDEKDSQSKEPWVYQRKKKLLEDVKKIIKSKKETVLALNDAGETALHVAIRTKASTNILKLLLEVDPSSSVAEMQDKNKCLPLHVALAHRTELVFIQALLHAYPEGVEKKDKKLRTPLHLIFDKNEHADPKVALQILEKFPKATDAQDRWGRTPLHTAIQFQAPLQVIQKLIEVGPSALSKKDLKERTPLCQAVEKKAPTPVVLEVLKAYPKAIIEENSNKRNPLHVAMECKSPLIVVKELVDKGPKKSMFDYKTKKALVMKDSGGLTPLAVGLKCQAPIDCVMLVLNACPKMTKVEDNEARLPLHIAMEHKAPNAPIVEALVEKNPKAPRALDQWLRTPLHSGMEFRAQVNAIKTVIGKYPQAADMVDSNKRYPLHLGMRFEAHKEAIQLVLDTNKGAIDKKDDYRHTPLHEALARRAPHDCVKVVLDCCSVDVIKEVDDGGRTCLHLGLEKEATGRVIEEVLKKCPDLAFIRDKDGNTPLHIGMMHKAKVDAIQALLKIKPKEATKVKNTAGCTPYDLGRNYRAPASCMEVMRKAEAGEKI
jgi:ankyrin repeat protein